MQTTLPPFKDLLRQLIAAASVSSASPDLDQSNRGVIDLLANWLPELGFRVELMAVTGHEGKYNLIATAGPEQQRGEGLVLSGHTDTVPFDEGAWNSDPFQLVERDNRYYGLGSADMKVFFPVIIAAVQALDLTQLKTPLTVLATADEESSMQGARCLVEADRRLGRYALIGEPTGLQPIHMHKGVMMEAIRVRGQSGHSSNPALGNNALEGMHRVIADLLEWREALQHRYQNPVFEVPTPTLNLGCIHGGDNPNRICGDCELQLDIRLLPGMAIDSVRDELKLVAERSLEGSGLTVELGPLFEGVPAFGQEGSSDIVHLAERLTGMESGTVAFATEGPFLQQLGIQTVVLGPGDIDQAHQPDEYVSLDRLQPMIDLVKQLIIKFCCQVN